MEVFYSLAPHMSSGLVRHCRLLQGTCAIAADVPSNRKDKAVSYTWNRRFEI